jgi:hypothetical protein
MCRRARKQHGILLLVESRPAKGTRRFASRGPLVHARLVKGYFIATRCNPLFGFFDGIKTNRTLFVFRMITTEVGPFFGFTKTRLLGLAHNRLTASHFVEFLVWAFFFEKGRFLYITNQTRSLSGIFVCSYK